MKKNIKFESALNRLEEIVELLESGAVELDKSLKIYEEGSELVKICLEKLNSADQIVKKISKNAAGDLKMEEFE